MNFLNPFLDTDGNILFSNLQDTKSLISLSKGMVDHYKKEIVKLSNISKPTFDNFIKPYDDLNHYLCTFYKLVYFYHDSGFFPENSNFIHSFDDLHHSAVTFENNNKKFIKKMKHFYKNKNSFSIEQKKVIETIGRELLSNGAFLSQKKQKQVMDANSAIEYLVIDFEKNLKSEEHIKSIFFRTKKSLEGIPEDLIKSFRKNAAQKKQIGYSIPLTLNNYLAVLQNCSIDSTREKMLKKFHTIGSNKNKYSNLPIIKKMLKLKYKKAKLLGYKNYAEYISQDNKVFQNVETNKKKLISFINQNNKLIKHEQEHLLKLKKHFKMNEENTVRPYDLRYLEHQQNKMNKDISKYFTLENTLSSLFYISKKFFNFKIKVNKKAKLPEGVYLFNIFENNKPIGNLYLDPFYRKNKPPGCVNLEVNSSSSFCKVSNNYMSLGYTKKSSMNNVFLTFEEVLEIYHEFGHFFQNLMGQGKYLSNKAVIEWDLVEFPSLFFEKILSNHKFIQSWAKHYRTKKRLPLSILKQVKKDGHPLISNQKHALLALLDLEIHQANPYKIKSIAQFEKDFYKKYEKYNIDKLINNDTLYLPILEHIFGDYDASYYSYLYALALESTVYKQIENKPHNQWKPLFTKLKNKFFAKLGSEKGIKLYKSLTKKEDPSFKNWHNQIIKEYYS